MSPCLNYFNKLEELTYLLVQHWLLYARSRAADVSNARCPSSVIMEAAAVAAAVGTTEDYCSSLVDGAKLDRICKIRAVCEDLLELGSNDSDVIRDCPCYLAVDYCGSPTISYPDDDGDLIEDVSDTSKLVLAVLYCVIIPLSGVGNLAVIGVFLCKSRLQTLSNMFLISLACSDLVMTLVCMPVNALLVQRRTWDFGELGALSCKLLPYAQTFGVAANIFTLVVIAIERFLAVMFPLKMKQVSHATYRVTSSVTLATVWLAAALLAIPNALWFEYASVCGALQDLLPDLDLAETTCEALGEEHFEYKLASCRIPSDLADAFKIYRLLFLVFLFLLPLIVTSVLYVCISVRLWSRKSVHNQCVTVDLLRMRTYKRVTLMLVTIQTLFIVCWSPTMLYEALSAYNDTGVSDESLTLRYYFLWLAMCNSCVNPLVYVFLHEKFRKSLTCSAATGPGGGKRPPKKTRVAPQPPQSDSTNQSPSSSTENGANQTTTKSTAPDMTSSK